MLARNPCVASLAIAGLALGLQAAPAKALTTWSWSFTTNNADQFGSGTFTTADVVPTAETTYSITGISGTYNRGGTAYTISGLSNYNLTSNVFRWDGTSTSPIILNFGGVSFTFSDISERLNIRYNSFTGFAAANATLSEFSGSDANITSSSLTPIAAAPVPGPLPLFGAAAAFHASRRLRRRLKTGA